MYSKSIKAVAFTLKSLKGGALSCKATWLALQANLACTPNHLKVLAFAYKLPNCGGLSLKVQPLLYTASVTFVGRHRSFVGLCWSLVVRLYVTSVTSTGER